MVVEKYIGYFVSKIEFCGWSRNLVTSCDRQLGKLLTLESDIPEFESWLRSVLVMSSWACNAISLSLHFSLCK